MQNIFLYSQNEAKILKDLPELKDYKKNNESFYNYSHIKEFACVEFNDTKLNSLDFHYNQGIEICYINKGKYHWQIEDKEFTLFPGDCFITFPWQKHGSPGGNIEIGQIFWIIIKPEIFTPSGKLKLGKWSGLSKKEQATIGSYLINNSKQHFNKKDIKEILCQIYQELESNRFGQSLIINHLIDKLFVLIMRSDNNHDIKNNTTINLKIQELEKKIRNNLAYKWTLQEMAEVAGVGQTSLNLLLKRETGFSPIQFLMDLRISTAIDALQNSSDNITKIAFDLGFCSSQYFSAAFKQKTGSTPVSFRKTINLKVSD